MFISKFQTMRIHYSLNHYNILINLELLYPILDHSTSPQNHIVTSKLEVTLNLFTICLELAIIKLVVNLNYRFVSFIDL